MKKPLLVLALLAAASCTPPDAEVARWEARAERVTIIRDDWGIPHIHGPTDADAVFGLMYAQAEDDFNRIEVNFLNSQGRLAEAEGEEEIWRDLRMKLFIDPADMQAQYEASPDWLRSLMDAWADGLNYYLHTHPEVTPRVLGRFEPWMALTFSEGSIGGDIERVSLRDLEAFYGSRADEAVSQSASHREPEGHGAGSGDPRPAEAAILAGARAAGGAWGMDVPPEPNGSNGFAIAPGNSASGNALLLINPHTSFFFRAEVHVRSDEGLDAYGAVTWGQFFVYQGFNERAGWMHTSSGVDNIDEYLETIVEREDGIYYRYGDEERPMTTRRVTVPYRTDTGMAEREFTVYRTHHGPVVREQDGRWVSVRLMEEPLKALTQSYMRTKATGYDSFRETMELHTNSSNNTVFADADGNIAYFHSNFIPRRDDRFDWSQPVDGSDPATEWGEPLSLDASPDVLNPSVGWIQNTNNWPFTVSGPDSPRREDFPTYVERGGENARGVHAIMVLEGKTGFTLQSLIDAAYDSYLPAFEPLVPALVEAWDGMPDGDSLKAPLAGPVQTLREWDLRWGVESVPTSLAVFWGEDLWRRGADADRAPGVSIADWMATGSTGRRKLEALAAAVERLEEDFGTWRTPWGEINRFQRLTGDIVQPFDDAGPSTPVGFTSSRWGSLASFGARPYEGTKRWYGTSGNSFVAVVEFGDSVRARAVTAGGLSSDPASPHFNDQAERYATGDLREVYFYPAQIEAHAEREYHPGR
ncbi:MAG TPA: penicillin acylase family protein [Longimicrobiales bacterium]|nr:penicillin acylase family protein [Longimicrobiales bacterium]